MKTYLLNPTIKGDGQFIREGRCMQKASSWATAWPPITLGVLAAISQKRGPIRLIDGNVENMTIKTLLDDIKSFAPDLIVVNTGFPSINNDMRVALKIKNTFPSIKILAFGVYFTLLEVDAVSNYPFLDFVIIGEPEKTFKELVNSLAKGKTNFFNIKGLAYIDSGKVKINEKRPLMKNIDEIPFPARDFIKNTKYRLPHNNKPFTLINSARGCPFNCIYCIVKPYYGNRVRRHSVNYIINEIRECKDKYGIQEFLFWEEVFTLDKKFVLELCNEIIKKGLNIKWAATTRVDTINEEVISKMKEAGCYLIGLGIESGDQKILDTAQKGQTIKDIKKAVVVCKKFKIKTMGHFIFGLPGETKKTANKTIKFMCKLGLDFMQAYCAVPYPKTEFGKMAKEKDWINAKQWSMYDFGGDSIVSTETISAKDITHFRQKAFRRFYYRPLFILKKFFNDISIHQLIKISIFFDWIIRNKRIRKLYGK